MSRVRVKICGITNFADARAAVECGADAVGFVFTEKSERFIAPQRVAKIIEGLPPFVTPVGVFVDMAIGKIADITRISGIRLIQLHGGETPETLAQCPVPAYKAFRVSSNFDVQSVAQFRSNAFLLDTFEDGKEGGTGKPFDWSIAVEAKKMGNLILAGGLSPENVHEAIEVVHPYAIDINSGIESYPGKKDHERMNRLFENIGSTRTKSSQEFVC